MQHIKNFRRVTPTAKQLKKYSNAEGDIPVFLRSDDGQDWYECQQNFADDTVKLMYDANGVIQTVVDKPVPGRGNTLAVSMLCPEDMSVAEVTALPDGFETDSKSWKFGDEGIWQDVAVLTDALHSENSRRYFRLRREAVSEIVMLQACAETGRGNPDDEARTQVLRTYLADLRETDLTAAEPDWPAQP